MKKIISPLIGLLFLLPNFCLAQTPVEGYVFEENNRGYLNQVKISIYRLPENALLPEIFSDLEGRFSANLDKGEYRLVFKKDVFHDQEEKLTVGEDKVFLKIELRRKPGYLFDATIADARTDADQIVDAVEGATIEIYNRTQRKPELVLRQHPNAFFQFTFEQGNHYTIMVRKPGYLAKRIEAFVNVKGCIICIDGVSNLRPGVTENLTAGNAMGTLLCNIEMERAKIDKRIGLQNIYYDYDKSEIRPDAAKELDKAVSLMSDNPTISVELGSHTDARGGDAYNLELSQKRAESAVAYIVSEGIAANRISAKGYGETQITNRCKNGVNCSDEEHERNRRTELRITGISADSLEYLRWQTLEEIARAELAKETLRELQNQKEYKIEEPKKEAKPEVKRIEKEEKNVKKEQPAPQAGGKNPVPMPKLEPTAEEKSTVEVEPAVLEQPKPSKENSDLDFAKPAAKTGNAARLLAKNFTGYAVEVVRADIELPRQHPIFSQFAEVLVQHSDDGMFNYFVGKSDNLAVARAYLQTIVLPKYPTARLVQFGSGVKSYPK